MVMPKDKTVVKAIRKVSLVEVLVVKQDGAIINPRVAPADYAAKLFYGWVLAKAVSQKGGVCVATVDGSEHTFPNMWWRKKGAVTC